MTTESSPPLSGRRAQAARNDTVILAAARDVFVAEPDAPVAAVAQAAGVGISALYRRYPSKEELLRKLCGDGLREDVAAAEAALGDDGDAFKVFRRFMTRVVEADAHTLTAPLTRSLDGSSEALFRDATKAQDLGERVFKRAQKGGAVRADAVAEDMANVLEQLSAIRGPSPKRTAELRRRYLTLHLDGLRPRKKAQTLPGPPPRWKDRASG